MRPGIIETNTWDEIEPFVIYVHANNDEFRDVEQTEDGEMRFPSAVHNALNYLGYEVELLYMVDMVTGDTTLTAAREGKHWLTLGPEQPSEETIRRGRENGAR